MRAVEGGREGARLPPDACAGGVSTTRMLARPPSPPPPRLPAPSFRFPLASPPTMSSGKENWKEEGGSAASEAGGTVSPKLSSTAGGGGEDAEPAKRTADGIPPGFTSAVGLDHLHWGGVARHHHDARSVASSMAAERDDKSLFEEPAAEGETRGRCRTGAPTSTARRRGWARAASSPLLLLVVFTLCAPSRSLAADPDEAPLRAIV